MANEIEQQQIQNALDELLRWARVVAYVDKEESVGSAEGFYHKLQTTASLLTGLKASVERYDETLKYYKERDGLMASDDYDPEMDKFVSKVGELNKRMSTALNLIVRYGGIDGAHHKQWVLDQVLRVLSGEKYDELVAYANDGEDGPATYEWDEGIAP